ncbi:MAG TPA: alpha/beta hydrolase [Pyrinomonadaceae bacterium]|jgi:pimeloyl-ACP methyl ester carboxylesterase
MGQSIFQNLDARNRLENWYEKFLERANVKTESRYVDSSHGKSHILFAGDKSHPPLVCLHGSLASSAHLLSELRLLAEHFYIIAPDLPGQSVRGLEKHMPLHDDSLSSWLIEVLNHLHLKEFNLLGVSWGGFVALQTTASTPQRVKRLVLIVPAGIVSGSTWKGLTQIALPMALYKMFPSEQRLRNFVAPMFSTWDEDWAHYMGDAVRDFVLSLKVPPLAKTDALQAFNNPALIIGGRDDITFPGDKLIERAKVLMPQAEVELIENCRHSPPTTDDFKAWLARRITQFLK